MKTSKLLILFILLAFFVTGCTNNTADQGDTVSVNYIGSLEDGTVFDTNIQSAAINAKLPMQGRTFEPLVFQLGAGSVIPGFENAVIGMRTGEQKTVTIPPDQGYGPLQDELIMKNWAKTIELKKDVIIPLANFKAIFRKEPQLQEILRPGEDPFQYKIISITDANVTLQNLATVGQVVQFPDVTWKTTVTMINATTISLLQDPKVGDKKVIQLQQGQQSTGTVSRVDERTYDIDLNHALAGRTLIFNITLVDITKN